MERTFPGESDFTACIFRGTVKIWGIARIVSMLGAQRAAQKAFFRLVTPAAWSML